MKTNMQFRRNVLGQVAPRGAVCYFLGAGFSRALNDDYPTARCFFMRDMPFLEQVGAGVERRIVRYDGVSRDLRGLLDRIEQQYGPLEGLDVEQVMTDLYVRAFGLGQAWERAIPVADTPLTVSELRRDYQALLTYVGDRLRNIDATLERYPLGERFVRALLPRDSVLTLNYDTLVERHLDSKDKAERLRRLQNAIGPPVSGRLDRPAPMFRGRAPGERGIFAKLHGSIDWITCPNENCPNHHYIQTISQYYPAKEEGPRFPGMNKAHCNTCGWSPEIVIVPPTAAKPFERFSKLNVMWSQAHEALRQAQRWVFIGVSFAATDFHLSALLRAASRDAGAFRGRRRHVGQICIVNKDIDAARDVKERLLSALSPQAQQCVTADANRIVLFESLEQYLDTVEEVDANRKDDSGADAQA